MNKIKIKTGDWVVVCDGRKALINVGDHAFPVLHTRGGSRTPGPVDT